MYSKVLYMPSLKKSPSISKKINGKTDEDILKDAIEFLFQIKGIQFTDKHPDFVPPCAEEFYTYLATLDPANTTPKKRACLSNHFHVFLAFLTPLHSDSHICASILASMSIVLYALTLYTITSAYLKNNVEKTPTPLSKVIAAIDTKETPIHKCFRKCIGQHMHYVPKPAIDNIMNVTDEFIRRSFVHLPKKMTEKIPETNTEIGNNICDGLDAVYNYEPFFLQWKAPLAILLTRCGVVPCRSMCEEIVEYVQRKT